MCLLSPDIVSDLGPVSISSVSSPVLEDGQGTLSLSCIAPANPPAQLMWVSNDTGEVVQYGSVLQFSPVLKQQSGSYYCSARNPAGNSSSEQYHLNVLCKCLQSRGPSPLTSLTQYLLPCRRPELSQGGPASVLWSEAGQQHRAEVRG